MLSVNKRPTSYKAPTKWQYRLSQFMLTRAYWTLSRVALPLVIVFFIGFQIWTSQGVRNLVTNVKTSIYASYAELPIFIVDEIVFQNATKLREDEIRDMLDFEVGTSYLYLDRAAMLEKLTSFDAVGNVQIRTSFTGTLEIVLQPRVPAMIFLKDGLYQTIDDQGRRVESLNTRDERAGLFVISGLGADQKAAEAKIMIEHLKPLAARVRGLVRVGERRWDIVLLNGAKIMLPEKHSLLALQTVLKQQRTNDLLNRNFKVYDLRNPERPVLRLNPDAVDQMDNLNIGVEGAKV